MSQIGLKYIAIAYTARELVQLKVVLEVILNAVSRRIANMFCIRYVEKNVYAD